MVRSEPHFACRLTECDHCGGLACLDELRPFYADDSGRIVGVEEEIFCPTCGQRTQAAGGIDGVTLN